MCSRDPRFYVGAKTTLDRHAATPAAARTRWDAGGGTLCPECDRVIRYGWVCCRQTPERIEVQLLVQVLRGQRCCQRREPLAALRGGLQRQLEGVCACFSERQQIPKRTGTKQAAGKNDELSVPSKRATGAGASQSVADDRQRRVLRGQQTGAALDGMAKRALAPCLSGGRPRIAARRSDLFGDVAEPLTPEAASHPGPNKKYQAWSKTCAPAACRSLWQSFKCL